MNKCPIFNLIAVPHSEVAEASRVFSKAEIEYHLLVKVPVEIAKCFELYQIAEITDDIKCMLGADIWEHQRGRIWYRFLSHKLNMDAGYHIYRLSFVNVRTNDTCSLYIAYVIQDNNPDKPYIYMKREYENEEKQD